VVEQIEAIAISLLPLADVLRCAVSFSASNRNLVHVLVGKANSAVQMGFVTPKDIAIEGVPASTGEGVDVRKRAGGRFAVLRFSGQRRWQPRGK
jgi:hypothetical protein